MSASRGRVVVDVPWGALDTFAVDTPGRIFYRVSGLDGRGLGVRIALPGAHPGPESAGLLR